MGDECSIWMMDEIHSPNEGASGLLRDLSLLTAESLEVSAEEVAALRLPLSRGGAGLTNVVTEALPCLWVVSERVSILEEVVDLMGHEEEHPTQHEVLEGGRVSLRVRDAEGGAP